MRASFRAILQNLLLEFQFFDSEHTGIVYRSQINNIVFELSAL